MSRERVVRAEREREKKKEKYEERVVRRAREK